MSYDLASPYLMKACMDLKWLFFSIFLKHFLYFVRNELMTYGEPQLMTYGEFITKIKKNEGKQKS